MSEGLNYKKLFLIPLLGLMAQECQTQQNNYRGLVGKSGHIRTWSPKH